MIRRRKMLLITATAFVVGFALAAQTTDSRDEDASRKNPLSVSWVPGTSSPMSAFESHPATLAPPQ
jgi:hypothetical protein